MNDKSYSRLEIIDIVKKLKGMIIPWKRSYIENDYEQGWNDAIKESRKNFDKYVKPWLELLEKKNESN